MSAPLRNLVTADATTASEPFIRKILYGWGVRPAHHADHVKKPVRLPSLRLNR